MSKLCVFGVLLAASSAFSALIAASASAAVTFLLAEWLVGGVGITSTQLVDAEGEILLEETILFSRIVILCSGIFDGAIGPNGAAEATELLTLDGVRVSSALEEASGLTCTNDENCPEPLVWALNLPWLGSAELMIDGTEEFFAGLGGAGGGLDAGYHIQCMGNGTSDTCTSAEAIGRLSNEANGTVDGEATEAFTELAGLKLASCEVAGNEAGILEGLGFGLLTAGGTLAVSE